MKVDNILDSEFKIQSTNDNTNDNTNNIKNTLTQKIESQKAVNPLMSQIVSSNINDSSTFFDNITIAKTSTKSSGFNAEFNKE